MSALSRELGRHARYTKSGAGDNRELKGDMLRKGCTTLSEDTCLRSTSTTIGVV